MSSDRQVKGWGRGYEGTGLGLSLTRRFINKMGGEIKVESKLGEGSTFIVKAPL
jgi:signal transduction histidine kinase